MIRCLIIKTSSLGDIIHTLPALTDAINALGDIQFDWVVEETFSDIPAWHPAVNRVIPIAIRRWRKQIFKTLFSGEWQQFKQQLKQQQYDYIIDAQGLLKSALISCQARGIRYGLDKYSAREPLASRFYQKTIKVEKRQHAVERIRQLFAAVLDYTCTDKIDYGLHNIAAEKTNTSQTPAVLFFHGTTWPTKHWPPIYWQELAQQLVSNGYHVVLPWSSDSEQLRAQSIKSSVNKTELVTILPKMSLTDIMHQLADIDVVVAVDTGLAHLAAALDKPQITLFGPTDPGLTRPYGNNQLMLQVDYPCRACMKKQCDKPAAQADNKSIYPACFSSLQPQQVYKQLTRLVSSIKP